jgi:cyclopropane fatty-acyl-phospholipid synthase-like methyltransferase
VIDPVRSFDRAALEYESARRGDPDALLDELPLGPDATVLDLGGTGKPTGVFVRRYARVLAVEPLEARPFTFTTTAEMAWTVRA